MDVEEAKKEVSIAILYLYELAYRDNPENPNESKKGATLAEIKSVVEHYRGKKVNPGTIWKILRSKYFKSRGRGRPVYLLSEEGMERAKNMLNEIKINEMNLLEKWQEENKKRETKILDIVFSVKPKKDYIEKIDEFLQLIKKAREAEIRGRDADAYKLYEKALEKDPLNPEILYNKGLILGRQQIISKAISEMEMYRKLYEVIFRGERAKLENYLSKKNIINRYIEKYRELANSLESSDDEKLKNLAPLAKKIVDELEKL